MVEPSAGRAHIEGRSREAEFAMVRDSLLDLAERISWREYEIDLLAVADAMLRRPRVERSICFARSPLSGAALR